MRILLVLVFLFFSIPSSAIEVSNFRSGLACTHTKLTEDGRGWICQPTEDILVTDQGSCVFNGERMPCTWVGFEFDYKNAKKHTKLQCEERLSEPLIHGNPKEVLDKGEATGKYELELEDESGHFYNPQYFTFVRRTKDSALLISKTSCKLGNTVVFEYQFKVHYPVPEN